MPPGLQGTMDVPDALNQAQPVLDVHFPEKPIDALANARLAPVESSTDGPASAVLKKQNGDIQFACGQAKGSPHDYPIFRSEQVFEWFLGQKKPMFLPIKDQGFPLHGWCPVRVAAAVPWLNPPKKSYVLLQAHGVSLFGAGRRSGAPYVRNGRTPLALAPGSNA